jgi:pSer/pThr/pTyr-binding forkhead associated (FHA) protein
MFGDAAIEKLHAKIVREDDRWVLLDADTPSGTLLNGQRITGPTPLHSGDTIQVGGAILSFGVRTRESAPAPAVTPATP